MPRVCTVCTHPERDAIDVALASRVSIRDVASRFGCGRNAVHRHASHRSSSVAVPSASVSTPSVFPPSTSRPVTVATRRAKQRAFLQALRETGNKLEAATAAGVDPVTPFRWAAKDPQFAERVAEAQARGDQLDLARCEGILRRRINNDKDPVSGILLMFRTKRLDPRYRDGSGVTVNAQGPVAISLGLEADKAPQDVGVEATGTRREDRRIKEIA